MATRKLKSHKGVSKRFRRTGGGKVMRRRAGMRHILTSKDRSRKRRLKRTAVVDPTMKRAVERLLPN